MAQPNSQRPRRRASCHEDRCDSPCSSGRRLQMEKHLGRNGIHLRAKKESGSGPKLGATNTNQKAAPGDSCPLRGGPTRSLRLGNDITTPDVKVAWSVMRLLQLQACLLLLVIGEPCRGPTADAAKGKGCFWLARFHGCGSEAGDQLVPGAVLCACRGGWQCLRHERMARNKF